MDRAFPHFTWSTLRSLGNSQAVRLSALFPFVGFWILFNDQVSAFLHMSPLDATTGPANGQWSLVNFIWKLKIYFYYFGLFALGVGSSIYQASCPYIIRKHADWSDYVRTDGDAMGIQMLGSLADVVGIREHDQIRYLKLEERRPLIMQRWFSQQSYEKPIQRLITAIFFGIGLILLSIPTFASLVKVTELLLR